MANYVQGNSYYNENTVLYLNGDIVRAAEAKRATEAPKPKAVVAGPSWNYQNPELDQLLAEVLTDM